MAYYHDLITSESWQELLRLKKRIPFVLIGGWAAYLYTKTLKSKDIDVVVDYPALSKLNTTYDVTKNERLRKYEGVKGSVHIDIYLPHYSRLGMPAEDIIAKAKAVEGFSVANPDMLFALKLITLADRGRTPKGRKDFLDLLSLAQSKTFDGSAISRLLTLYRQQSAVQPFQTFLNETTSVPEIGLNTHAYARLKKRLQQVLG